METYQPDYFLKKLWQKIYINSRIAFVACFLIGVLVHMFMLSNKLPNHDDFFQLFDTMHRSMSGRWFLFFPASFSSVFSLPWVNGLLSILYVSIASSLVVKCLNIKSALNSVLIAGLMITFPTVCTTLSYMSSADGYFFSLMLACLAVYLTDKYFLGCIPGIILLTLSLGIYQAYFGFAAAFMVAILLREVVINKHHAHRYIFIKILRFLALLTLAILLYMFITKMVPTELSTYMGIDKMGIITFSELPSLILGSYSNIFAYFFEESMGLHLPLVNIVITIITLTIFVMIFSPMDFALPKQGAHSTYY